MFSDGLFPCRLKCSLTASETINSLLCALFGALGRILPELGRKP
ncbi:hypothetical protein NEIFLAOT_01786 [Neisseria flavescens NRL30031/H210]|uniref:Uncharacterized protein n=1 Tax=Neisseria flavescens NRL30031/H210 TaxID=546264 RepID=C0EP97_NEIFL|nr:hypothetical protein NEIFLAOT_01786 [Neisseria flavescens NRL30031/H210]